MQYRAILLRIGLILLYSCTFTFSRHLKNYLKSRLVFTPRFRFPVLNLTVRLARVIFCSSNYSFRIFIIIPFQYKYIAISPVKPSFPVCLNFYVSIFRPRIIISNFVFICHVAFFSYTNIHLFYVASVVSCLFICANVCVIWAIKNRYVRCSGQNERQQKIK
jgi:hypothetical protein